MFSVNAPGTWRRSTESDIIGLMSRAIVRFALVASAFRQPDAGCARKCGRKFLGDDPAATPKAPKAIRRPARFGVGFSGPNGYSLTFVPLAVAKNVRQS